jgi:uncharacterized heparinase superfamily protein
VVFKDSKSHLIADIGNIGPDYLPGHAHADTLSFELAINGDRLIVNSGTSVYGDSHERLRQRGTSAHSTIEIDNQNSSEVWSGFRVARRARSFNIQMNSSEVINKLINFSASHDGYKRLNSAAIHNRNWSLNDNEWIINDTIIGNKNLIISRYYLHPDMHIEKDKRGYIISKSDKNLAFVEIFNSKEIEIIDSTFHDEFGISIPNKCIQVKAFSPSKLGIKIQLI